VAATGLSSAHGTARGPRMTAAFATLFPYNNGSFGRHFYTTGRHFRCTFPVDFFHDFSGRDLGEGSVPLLGSVQFDSVGHSGYGDEGKKHNQCSVVYPFYPQCHTRCDIQNSHHHAREHLGLPRPAPAAAIPLQAPFVHQQLRNFEVGVRATRFACLHP
jgi:hypothetical protein